jgi:hypothetical protein
MTAAVATRPARVTPSEFPPEWFATEVGEVVAAALIGGVPRHGKSFEGRLEPATAAVRAETNERRLRAHDGAPAGV